MSDIEPGPRAVRRAVQYLRMSSEHQRYSIERQSDLIAEYAQHRGYEIVRTYADPGKSGLSLKGRKGLQQLLADTLSQTRDFDTILVLDVSRWGRFQDPDQAGHYEFICKQAGVQIAYCAELFENDGSMASSVIKILKRLMAGEYSRDLSAKMSIAHLRHARLGYIQGQLTPYGIRRQLVDYRGTPRCILQPGERKALQGDRVVWVLGPDHEIKTVRKIFDLYVKHKLSALAISKRLQSDPDATNHIWKWTRIRVRTVLSNEVYIGKYIYNKRSTRLQSKETINDESEWARTEVLPPIINRIIFDKAKALQNKGHWDNTRYSTQDLLKKLRILLSRKGELSSSIVAAEKNFPSRCTFVTRFGSMENAFAAIGYSPKEKFRDPEGNVWTDESLLKHLCILHARIGYVSKRSVSEAKDLPSYYVYSRRFGSVRLACARAGLPWLSTAEISALAHARQRQLDQGQPPRVLVRRDGRRVWTNVSPEALVNGLRQLLDQHGYLSEALISEAPDLPSRTTVCAHFGSLLAAYEAVGWPKTRLELQAERNRREGRKAKERRGAAT